MESATAMDVSERLSGDLDAATSEPRAFLRRGAQHHHVDPASTDELVALIAHDLRSPLNIVLMATELLSGADAPGDAARERWLSVIRDAAGRMNAMIGDLLEMCRLEAGRIVLDLRPQALRPLLLEATHAHQPMADLAGVALRICACAPDLVAVVDRSAMLRVLGNLIDNAIRFTPAGGCVVLGAERHRAGIRVTVRDTGIGIRREDLPHVFDRFWQARQARRGSAGLGLTIVRAIVEEHEGCVNVQSEPGQGTQFEILLPDRIGAMGSGPGQ